MQTITLETLKQKIDNDKNFILVNTLSPENFEKEHIPGSCNIPYDAENFEEKVAEEVPSKDTEIIVTVPIQTALLRKMPLSALKMRDIPM